MIAAQQDLGYLPAAEVWRARVVWILQQARRVRLLCGGVWRQHARHEAAHGIHHHHRRQLAARQHIVADGELVGRQMRAHPLVNAFIVAAEQRDARLRRQLARDGLRENAPGRVEQDDRAALVDGFDGGEERLRLHHHAGAAAIGIVVHDMVAIGGGVARVVQRDLEQPLGLRPRQDAFAEWAAKHLGQQGEDVESHGRLLQTKNSSGLRLFIIRARGRRVSAGGCAPHERPPRQQRKARRARRPGARVC